LEAVVAATMLPHPEPTKEVVESTTLGIAVVKILQSTWFTLVLLSPILRSLWRNHHATHCRRPLKDLG